MQTLIVVYNENDEIAINLLRKLLETKDDTDNSIVGVEDRTVQIVPWVEKIWLQNKESGTIQSKVLLIGKVKGAEQLLPVIDAKYEKYGITYGWAGSQAVLSIDEKVMKKEATYQAFLNEVQNKAAKNVIKGKKKVDFDMKAFAKIAIASMFPLASTVTLIKDDLDNKKLIRQQMLMFGINELYYNHLDQFMKE